MHAPTSSTPSDGRVRDLRISVTDRCNFRCTYCMPAEGMEWLPRDGAAHLRGDRARRPGLRRALRLRRHPPHRRRADRAGPPAGAGRASCARASGVDLAHDHQRRHAPARRRRPARPPGCDRVNVSLDSLRRERFLAMTRRDELDRVLDGIDAAHGGRLRPGQGQRRRRCGASTTTRSSTSPTFGREPRRRACASSSSCRSTPSGDWADDQVVTPGRDRRRHRRRLPARAGRRRAARRRPTAGATSTGGARSA